MAAIATVIVATSRGQLGPSLSQPCRFFATPRVWSRLCQATPCSMAVSPDDEIMLPPDQVIPLDPAALQAVEAVGAAPRAAAVAQPPVLPPPELLR